MNSVKIYNYIIAGVMIIIVLALALWLMGRYPICECGYIKLWHGIAASPETSQHLSDWYTPSHIIHGFLFYGLLWFLVYRWPKLSWLQSFGVRLIAAILLEAGWELIENTNWIIDYYRQNTLSIEYNGDTIINSVFDVLWMMGGFLLAWRLPTWASIGLVIVMELVVLYFVRDNLTLNILFFIYPFPTILEWQQG